MNGYKARLAAAILRGQERQEKKQGRKRRYASLEHKPLQGRENDRRGTALKAVAGKSAARRNRESY